MPLLTGPEFPWKYNVPHYPRPYRREARKKDGESREARVNLPRQVKWKDSHCKPHPCLSLPYKLIDLYARSRSSEEHLYTKVAVSHQTFKYPKLAPPPPLLILFFHDHFCSLLHSPSSDAFSFVPEDQGPHRSHPRFVPYSSQHVWQRLYLQELRHQQRGTNFPASHSIPVSLIRRQ